MPGPVWNYIPKKANGQPHMGWDRRSPYEKYTGWQPQQVQYAEVTEPGGGMIAHGGYMSGVNGMNGVNGMGDMFIYPQGAGPQFFADQPAFFQQPAELGPMVQAEPMDETPMWEGGGVAPREGEMAWEQTKAPWDQPGFEGRPAMAPDAAPNRIREKERKVAEAAQAAKVAADNAVRAAKGKAPRMAALNAATARCAANVAAGQACSERSHQLATVAQNDATKAVAAANMVARNGVSGMSDWMELSGFRGLGFFDTPVVGGVQVKHLVYAGVGAAVLWWAKKRWF